MSTLLRLRPDANPKVPDMFQVASSFRVVCLICKRADLAAPLAVPLCGLCVGDLDRSQAHINALKDAAIERHAAGFAAWEAALGAADAPTAAWWGRVADLLDFADVERANTIMDKAAALGGRAAPLVAAWRAWGRECARCADLLLRADHMQRAVNTARLAEVGVL